MAIIPTIPATCSERLHLLLFNVAAYELIDTEPLGEDFAVAMAADEAESQLPKAEQPLAFAYLYGLMEAPVPGCVRMTQAGLAWLKAGNL